MLITLIGVVAVLLTFWGFIGALIGVAASTARGFHVAAGIIGGVVLGPFAVLLYLARERPRCRFCRDFIRPYALVCKHCGRDLTVPAAPAAPVVAPPAPKPTDVSRKGRCRLCDAAVPVDAGACPRCLAPVRTDYRKIIGIEGKVS